MPTKATIIARVKRLLGASEHGTQIDVLKMTAQAADLYGQGARTFASAVTVYGRGVWSPQPEEFSMIGDADEVEIAFVFSCDELDDKITGAADYEWITKDDEIGFEGKRFRVLSVHRTGKVEDTYVLMVVLAETAPGTAEETYP